MHSLTTEGVNLSTILVDPRTEIRIFVQVTSFDADLSGWSLLADRMRGVLAQSRIKMPRYSDILDVLTYVSHSRQLRAVRQANIVDLYLRPNGISDYSIMDYHRMEVRYAFCCHVFPGLDIDLESVFIAF